MKTGPRKKPAQPQPRAGKLRTSRAVKSDLAPALAEKRAECGLTERPLFAPWERFAMLTHAADDLPASRANDAVRVILLAAAVTIRNLAGTADRHDAYGHIANAQVALRALMKEGAST